MLVFRWKLLRRKGNAGELLRGCWWEGRAGRGFGGRFRWAVGAVGGWKARLCGRLARRERVGW